MGYNTTVVIYNDALGQIAQDPKFGEKLEQAAQRVFMGDKEVSIPSGHYANAAMVVESHHADSTSLVTVGGNLGICHMVSGGWSHNKVETQVRLLEKWAEKLGYDIVKKKA